MAALRADGRFSSACFQVWVPPASECAAAEGAAEATWQKARIGDHNLKFATPVYILSEACLLLKIARLWEWLWKVSAWSRGLM